MINLKTLLPFVVIFMVYCLNYVEATEGVIVWADWYRVRNFKCLKEKFSAEFVIVRAAYRNNDQITIDDNAKTNIINARAAGFEEVDIYINPCVFYNQPSENIITVLNHFKKEPYARFGNIWLQIRGLADSQDYQGWHPNGKAKNVEFIKGMVDTLIYNNQSYGIYTNKYNWHEITGNTQNFKNVSLLYQHLDEEKNFEDYDEYGYPFGEWEKPTMKKYSYKDVCGMTVSHVWRP